MNSKSIPNQHYPLGNKTRNDFKWLQTKFGFPISILATILLFILLFLPLQNIQAQCGIIPDPADPTTGTIAIPISTSGSTVILDGAALSAKGIAPLNGPGLSCQLYLNIGGSLMAIAPGINFTCDGTGTPTAAPFSPGPYSIVADDDGTVDANTTAAVMIEVSIVDTGDPTFTAGTCTAPAGGPFSTNADGANNDDCRTAIPGLMHPGTDDNCDGEMLTVVYDNPNDPANNTTPVTVTEATTNTYQFYAGTTMVTYTVSDGTNTDMCNFTVVVEDNEKPEFTDPSVALSAALQDEVSINYISPVAGNHSGRVNIVLNCDSPNYATDLAAVGAFMPTATDNCGSATVSSLSGPITTALACGTRAGAANTYERIVYLYEATDAATPPNTLTAPNEEFIILIFTQDITPPNFNPATSAAIVPAAPTPANIDETTAGTAGDPFLYGGGSVTFGTNASFNTVTARGACAVDFMGSVGATTSALGVLPDDCQAMTFISSINDGTGVIFTGSTNDVVTDAGGAMTTFAVGSYTITYTATDACNQVSEYSFTLNIVDDTPPVLDCSIGMNTLSTGSPYTTDPSGCETSVLYEAPIINDNCSPPGVAPPVLTAAILNEDGNATTLIVDLNAGGTPLMHSVELPVGNWQIQYTLTDGSTLTDVCTLPVEVIDIQNPSITCGPSQTINSICPQTNIPDFTGNATLFDNCGPGDITVTQDPPAASSTVTSNLGTVAANDPTFSLADGQQFTITLTATQNGTNLTDDCTFIVTISDGDAPVPDTSPLPSIDASTTLTAECGTVLLAPYTATDCVGTQIVGIPSNADAFIDTNNDNIPDTYVYNTGFNFVTWTYDDGNGNVATQTQSINVSDDNTDPIITITNNSITRNTSPGLCVRNQNLTNFLTEVFPSTAPFSDPANQTNNRQYIDNCGVVSLEYEVNGATTIARTDLNAASQLKIGSNIVTFYATDAAGNEGSNTVEIIVEDNEAPVASIPSAITLSMGDANDNDPTDCAYTISDGSLVDPTATDNCGMAPPTRTLLNVSATLADGGTFSAPTPQVLGSLEGYTFNVANDMSAVFTADYMFDDGNGQTINKSITITVVDDRMPDITCPTDVTKDTDGNCQYEVTGTEFDLVAVSDNCTNTADLTISNDYNHGTTLAGAIFMPGTTTVTWTVTDVNGKSSTCEFDVIVEDNLEPTLNCIDINRNLLSNGTVTVTAGDFLTSISDACDDGTNPNYYTISIDETSFDCSDATNTPIEVEIMVTDPDGNLAICRPTITIQETVAPTASCLSVSRDLSATAPGMVTVNASELNNGSTANCPVNTPGLVFSFTPDANNPMTSMDFDCDDTGGNPVNFYAIDPSGNISAPCPAVITIVDATNITIQCQDVTKILDMNGSATIDASEFNNGSTDNCGSTSTLTYNLVGIGSSITVGCAQIGPNPYVLEISDGNNTTTCNVVLTVVDQTGPVADCQPVSVNLTGSGTRTINASMFNNNSMDICSGSNVSFEFADGSPTMTVDCNDLGTNPITITVRDNVGNPTTCTTTLTVGPENPAVFTAGTVSGGTGATVDIDITADDYYEMVSWQFSGDIDPAFATINSITTSFGGIFTPQFDASTGEFQMAYSEFPGITLGDGVVVATINVTLVSTVVGSSTTINLKDGPLALEIAQGCSQAPQPTDIDEATHLVDGQLTIANGQVTISGTIENDQGDGIPNVDIAITGDVLLNTSTDATGAYSVVVPGGSTVTLTPTKDTNHKNGVSALDAAIVQALANNTASTTLIPTPTRRIAADPNTSQSFSVADAGIISFVNVISGATFHNPPGYDVNSWVFVDGGHIFTDPLDPWNAPYDDAITYTNVTSNQINQNFTGIKIGDVTGDADVNMLTGNGDTRTGDLLFTIQDQGFEAGAAVSIPLTVKSFEDLIAFQTTLNFNAAALTFTSISTDLLDQTGNTVMDLSQAGSGLLAMSWYSGQSVDITDDEVTIVLNFTANETLETLAGQLSFSEDLIAPGAWHTNQEAIGVDLTIEVLTNIADEAAGFKLFQNRPNPFRSNTLISFSLPEAEFGTISIYDISGRLVHSVSENYNSGYHEVEIDRSQLSGGGVYLYQFKTDKYTATKKLTLID